MRKGDTFLSGESIQQYSLERGVVWHKLLMILMMNFCSFSLVAVPCLLPKQTYISYARCSPVPLLLVLAVVWHSLYVHLQPIHCHLTCIEVSQFPSY